MIADILMILLFMQIIKIVGSVAEFPSTTEYPTLSGGVNERTGNGFGIFSNVLFIIQSLLLILLTYSGFKTGMNYKQRAENTIHKNV